MDSLKVFISRKRMLSFALAALMIGSLFGGALWSLGGVSLRQGLATFSSYEELVAFLRMRPQDAPQSLYQRLVTRFQYGILYGIFYDMIGSQFLQAGTGSQDSTRNIVPEYSTTNIQVEGVDEADIVKTDGEYLYLASGSAVYIMSAYPPENATTLSKLNMNTTVAGIFVNDAKLVILQNSATWTYTRSYPYYTVAKTSIMVYDISDRTKPALERLVTVNGSYISSRMISDYVYIVVNEPPRLENGAGVVLPDSQLSPQVKLALPEVRSGNETIEATPSDIYHTELPDTYYSFTNIVAINVKDVRQSPTVKSLLLGTTSKIYVSTENIYLTSHTTNIHKISIKEGSVTYDASGFVPGSVLNQFSMDEYEGFFRIATSTGKSNNVYILDDKLNVVGKLEGLAPGESLHSARFMGDRGYLVTFKKVDPLFVIDLENPKNPQVLGLLKIPGYSDYLHPYDATHLIGVGKETVEAKEGNFAWYQGVKISLFDVSNVSQPKEIDKVVIGDRGTDSPVLSDHKAFLFSRTKNLLVLPILLAVIDPAKYPSGVPSYVQGDFVWQGAYVFNVTLDEGFAFKGGVTHLDNSTELIKSGYYSSPYSVKRALYIDDLLYTLSDRMVKMNSLEDLKEIGALNLP